MMRLPSIALFFLGFSLLRIGPNGMPIVYQDNKSMYLVYIRLRFKNWIMSRTSLEMLHGLLIMRHNLILL